MFRKPASLALLVMLLHAAGARADDAGDPVFSLSGFGTLGVTHSSEHQADFSASNIRPTGAGYTSAWSADVDSRIGVQAVANFTPRWSAVLQVISEQNYDGSYRPHAEWANVKFEVTPDFSVRAGRIVLPAFLVSDHQKVGYANPWVRPPVELYNLVPITNSDGVDASYRVRVGEFTSTVQGIYGGSRPGLPAGGGTAKAKDAKGVSYTGEVGAATVHVAYLRANVTLNATQPLFDAFRQFGAQGIALADKYDTNDKPFSLLGIGGLYDPGGWFLTGEWGATDNHSAFGKRTAWYASGGYRIGKFTPYLNYAQARARSNASDPGLSLAGLPPALAGAAAGLNTGLNAVLGTIPVQTTISVGGRWDFAKNLALKLQYNHIRIGAGSPGTLVNIQPGFQPGGKVDVFSATVDFVF
jgi:hypothetical protein